MLARLQLGWTEVPTIRLDHLSLEQARAFTIADNRLAETATWNERLLAETLRDLSLADLDFSLEVMRAGLLREHALACAALDRQEAALRSLDEAADLWRRLDEPRRMPSGTGSWTHTTVAQMLARELRLRVLDSAGTVGLQPLSPRAGSQDVGADR